MIVRGADGSPGGWALATLDTETRRISLAIASTETLLASPEAMTAVDMPIGVLAVSDRVCDRAARALLSPAGSRVFPTPARPVLAAGSYQEALAAQRAADGKGLGPQTYGIVPKIAALDLALRAAPPETRERIRETHPELVFLRLTDGASRFASKHTPEGLALRYETLAETVDRDDLDQALRAFKRREAKPDDILDAVACALAAERLARGDALFAGDPESRDEFGLPMAIAY